MVTQIDKFFRFDSLSEYSLRQRMLIRGADLAFYGMTRLAGAFSRFEVVGLEHWQAVEAAGKTPIYVFWHDSIILGACFFRNRGIVIMASKSLDGEYISRFVKRMGFGVIRGSSSRGGSRALIEMIRASKAGHPMAFTIDGPRGPRHQIKPGPVMLARKTGNAILPLVIQPQTYWTLNSWDRLHIPRPFTRAVLIFGRPIYVRSIAGDVEMEANNIALQESMDNLTRHREIWLRRGEIGHQVELEAGDAIDDTDKNSAEKSI